MKLITMQKGELVTEREVNVSKDERYWWYGGTHGSFGGENTYGSNRTSFSKTTFIPSK